MDIWFDGFGLSKSLYTNELLDFPPPRIVNLGIVEIGDLKIWILYYIPIYMSQNIIPYQKVSMIWGTKIMASLASKRIDSKILNNGDFVKSSDLKKYLNSCYF